jgi:RNA polymerase sigma-70 factor (ECF subfamily)
MGSAGDGLYLQVLVVRCQLGDRGAFAEILSVCQPRLRAYLHKMLPGSQDVDDVAQDVWADVFRDLSSLTNPGSFLPWLYRVAHNRAARLMRAPRPPTASWDDLTEIGEADESLEFTAEDAQAVHDALARLTDVHREVLLLRFLEDMSYEDISVVLQCPVGTVRSRIHHAKAALRQILEDVRQP